VEQVRFKSGMEERGSDGWCDKAANSNSPTCCLPAGCYHRHPGLPISPCKYRITYQHAHYVRSSDKMLLGGAIVLSAKALSVVLLQSRTHCRISINLPSFSALVSVLKLLSLTFFTINNLPRLCY